MIDRRHFAVVLGTLIVSRWTIDSREVVRKYMQLLYQWHIQINVLDLVVHDESDVHFNTLVTVRGIVY